MIGCCLHGLRSGTLSVRIRLTHVPVFWLIWSTGPSSDLLREKVQNRNNHKFSQVHHIAVAEKDSGPPHIGANLGGFSHSDSETESYVFPMSTKKALNPCGLHRDCAKEPIASRTCKLLQRKPKSRVLLQPRASRSGDACSKLIMEKPETGTGALRGFWNEAPSVLSAKGDA